MWATSFQPTSTKELCIDGPIRLQLTNSACSCLVATSASSIVSPNLLSTKGNIEILLRKWMLSTVLYYL